MHFHQLKILEGHDQSRLGRLTPPVFIRSSTSCGALDETGKFSTMVAVAVAVDSRVEVNVGVIVDVTVTSVPTGCCAKVTVTLGALAQDAISKNIVDKIRKEINGFIFI
jgi:hypothetical protein